MKLYGIFNTLYDRLAPQRNKLLYTVGCWIALTGALFATTDLREDISTMLPDRGGTALDFKLLNSSPLAKKVLIDVAGEPGVETGVILKSAQKLAKALGEPHFANVNAGPGEDRGLAIVDFALKSLPRLEGGELLEGWDREAVREKLGEAHAKLASVEGWMIKGMVRADPLGLSRTGFENLAHARLTEKLGVRDGLFVSEDGRHGLVLADGLVDMTDAAGAAGLVAQFEEAAERTLPKGVSATLVAPHRYTLANTSTIKTDVYRVLGVSAAGLVAIFLLLIRRRRGLFVFAVPFAVLCTGGVAVRLFFPAVSRVTLGFGAIILGITVDFAVHVFFALQARGTESAARTMELVSRPVLLGGVTTIGTFCVLLFSTLPGQRQLAVFAVGSLLAALALALVVLPHLLVGIGSDAADKPPVRIGRVKGAGWIIIGWLAFVALAGYFGMQLEFDGNMRAMSVESAELKEAEVSLAKTWGDVRGKAMVFASGGDLEAALELNGRVLDELERANAASGVVSLAQLLPTAKTQETNLASWRKEWTERGADITRFISEEGAKLGFSEIAFDPFFEWVGGDFPPVTTRTLEEVGLGPLVSGLLVDGEDGVSVITLLPDSSETMKLFDESDELRYVSPSGFSRKMSGEVGSDFTRYVFGAMAVVVCLLFILFRDPKRVGAALVPVITGLAGLGGVMVACGMSFNLFNVVASALVIGLGVDYGIFMVCKFSEGYDLATERAVLVSGLTTLAGIGALTMANHPALFSIGITVFIGVAVAIPSALLVVPAIITVTSGGKQ